jgi:hypothetical protein
VRSPIRSHRPALSRGTAAQLDDDDQAIQNDAPAARMDVDEHVRPGLRALGVLASSFDRLPDSSAFTPRSPRGPPLAI